MSQWKNHNAIWTAGLPIISPTNWFSSFFCQNHFFHFFFSAGWQNQYCRKAYFTKKTYECSTLCYVMLLYECLSDFLLLWLYTNFAQYICSIHTSTFVILYSLFRLKFLKMHFNLCSYKVVSVHLFILEVFHSISCSRLCIIMLCWIFTIHN
jgi:hypothetical protein